MMTWPEMLRGATERVIDEIDRHHKDFMSIVKALDDWDDGEADCAETLLKIRGIVGHGGRT